MATQSYRGLTIRIGGDTTSLQKALKTANGAASQTSLQLKKVGDALRLDPNNIRAYNAQLGFMSNQATNAAMKLAHFGDAANELGKKLKSIGSGSGDAFKDISGIIDGQTGSVDNLALKLSQTQGQVNRLTVELAKMHTGASDMMKTAAGIEGTKLSEAFNLALGIKSVKEMNDSLANLGDGIERTDEQIGQMQESVIAMGDDLKEVLSLDLDKMGSGLRSALQKAVASNPSFTLDEKGTNEAIEQVVTLVGKLREAQAELRSVDSEHRKTSRQITKDANAAVAENKKAIEERNKLIGGSIAAFRQQMQEYDSNIARLQKDADQRNKPNLEAIERLTARRNELDEQSQKQIADLEKRRAESARIEVEAEKLVAKQYGETYNQAVEDIERLKAARTNAETQYKKDLKSTKDSLASYGESFKKSDIFSELSEQISEARREGNDELVNQLNEEINTRKASYATEKQQLESHLAELKSLHSAFLRENTRQQTLANQKRLDAESELAHSLVAVNTETYDQLVQKAKTAVAQAPEGLLGKINFDGSSKSIDALEKRLSGLKKSVRESHSEVVSELEGLVKSLREAQASMGENLHDALLSSAVDSIFAERQARIESAANSEVKATEKIATANNEASEEIRQSSEVAVESTERQAEAANELVEANASVAESAKKASAKTTEASSDQIEAVEKAAGASADVAATLNEAAEAAEAATKAETDAVLKLADAQDEVTESTKQTTDAQNKLLQAVLDARAARDEVQGRRDAAKITYGDTLKKTPGRLEIDAKNELDTAVARYKAVQTELAEDIAANRAEFEKRQGKTLEDAMKDLNAAQLELDAAEARLRIESGEKRKIRGKSELNTAAEIVAEIEIATDKIAKAQSDMDAAQTTYETKHNKIVSDRAQVFSALNKDMAKANRELVEKEAELASITPGVDRTALDELIVRVKKLGVAFNGINNEEILPSQIVSGINDKIASTEKVINKLSNGVANTKREMRGLGITVGEARQAYEDFSEGKKVNETALRFGQGLHDANAAIEVGRQRVSDLRKELKSLVGDGRGYKSSIIFSLAESLGKLESSGAFSIAAESGQKVAKSITEPIANGMSEVSDRASEAGASISRVFDNTSDEGKRTIAVLDALADALYAYESQFVDLADGQTLSKLGGGEIAKGDVDALRLYIEELKGLVSGLGIGESLVSFSKVEGIVQKMKDGKFVIEDIKDAVDSTASSVENVADATKETVDATSDAKNKLRQIQEYLNELNDVYLAIEDGVTFRTREGFVLEDESEIEEYANDLKDRLYDAGLKSMSGLASAVASGLEDEGTQIMSAMVDSIRDVDTYVLADGIYGEFFEYLRQEKSIGADTIFAVISGQADEASESAAAVVEATSEVVDASEKATKAASENVEVVHATAAEAKSATAAIEAETEAMELQLVTSRELFVSEKDLADARAQAEQDRQRIDDEIEGKEKQVRLNETLLNQAREQRREYQERADSNFEDELVRRNEAVAESEESIAAATDRRAQAEAKYATDSEAAISKIVKYREKLAEVLNAFGASINVEAFSFENENTDPSIIIDALTRVAASIGLTDDQLNDFVEDLRRLDKKFVVTSKEAGDMRDALKFTDTLLEMQKLQAQIRNYAKVMSDINVPSSLLKSLGELTETSKVLESAYSRLSSAGKGIFSDNAMSPDRTNSVALSVLELAHAELTASENAEVLARRLSAYDTEKIDQVADATKSATMQLIDARLNAEQLREQLAIVRGRLAAETESKNAFESQRDAAALESDEYLEKIALVKSLQEEEERLSVKEREAAAALEGAKMRSEFDGIAASAEKARIEVVKASEAMQNILNEQAVLNAFGDRSGLDGLQTTFDALVKRAGTFSSAIGSAPDNVELMSLRMKATNDALDTGRELAERILDTMSHISDSDMSRIESMKAEFASSAIAVRATSNEVERLTKELVKAREARAVIPNDFAGIENKDERAKAISAAESIADSQIAVLEEKLSDARKRATDASLYAQMESLEEWYAQAITKVNSLSDSIDITPKASIESMKKYAESIKESFDSSMLDGVRRQFAELDAQLESAKARIGEIDEKINASGSSETLLSRRADAVAEAVSVADKRAELFRNTLSQFGDESAFDGLEASINRITDDLLNTRKQIESVFGKLAEYASEHRLGGDFVSGLKDLTLNGDMTRADFDNAISGLPEEVRELVSELRTLSQEELDLTESLGIDAVLKGLASMRASARETGDVVADSFRLDEGRGKFISDISASAEEYVQSIKDAFGDGSLFSGLNRQLESLDERIEGSRDRVDELRKQIESGTGDKKSLAEQLVAEIGSAAITSREKLLLLDDAIESLGTDGRAEYIASTFTSAHDAVNVLGEDLSGVEASLDHWINETRRYASENDFGEGWIESIVRLGTEVVGLDDKFDETFSALPERAQQIVTAMQGLSVEKANMSEMLGLASALAYLEEMKKRATETSSEIDELRESLGNVELNSDILSSASKYVDAIRSAFGEDMFSGLTKQLSAVDSVIDVAQRRISEIDALLASGNGDKDSLMRERLEQVGTVASSSLSKIGAIDDVLTQLGGNDSLSRLVEEFGSVDNAIEAFSDELVGVRLQTETVFNDIDRYASDNGLGKAWSESIKDLSVSVGILEPEAQKLRDALVSLASEETDIAGSLGLAMALKYMRELGDESEAAFRKIRESVGITNIGDAVGQYVNDIKSAFGEGMMTELNEQSAETDAALERIGRRIGEIDDEISNGGDRKSLMEERFRLVEEAVASADKRASLFRETINAIDASELDGLKSDLSNIDDIIKRLTTDVFGKRATSEYLKNEIKRQIASGVDEASEEIGSLRDRLAISDSEELDLSRKLGIAVLLQSLVGVRDSMDVTGDKIREQFDNASLSVENFIEEMQRAATSDFLEKTFGSLNSEINDMQSVFDGAKSRLGALSNALDELGEESGLGAEKVLALNEAIFSGERLVAKLEAALSNLSGNVSIEEVRERFGSVGNAVVETSNAIADTARRLDEVRSAMASFGGDLDSDEYKKLVEEEERLVKLLAKHQSLASDATIYQQYERLQQVLASVNSEMAKLRDDANPKYIPFSFDDDIVKRTREFIDTASKSFGEGVISKVSPRIDEYTSQIETAKSRVKALDDQISAVGESEELVAQRMAEVDKAAEAANKRFALVRMTVNQFGGDDAIEKIVEKWGSLGIAVSELESRLAGAKAEFEAYKKQIYEYANENELGEVWANAVIGLGTNGRYTSEYLDALFSGFSDELPERIQQAIMGMQRAMSESADIGEEFGLASVLKYLESIETKAMETGDVVREQLANKVKEEVKEFEMPTFDDMLKSATSFVDTFKKTTDDMFSVGFGEQFEELTERLDRAKAKVEEIDAEIAAQGSSEELAEKRVRAVANAAEIAAERARLFKEMFESLGGEGALDGLTSDIRELSDEFLGTRMQIEQVRGELQKIANAEGFDVSWVDEMMRLGEHDFNANVDNEVFETFSKLPTEVQDCIISLQELNAEQADLGEALGPKLFMQALMKMRSAAKESSDDIYNKYKKKIKIEVDDSFSKELDEFSKRMKDFGFNNTGIDEMLEDLDALGKQIKSNTDYYDELLKLYKDDSVSDFLRDSLTESSDALIEKLQTRIERTKEALDELKKTDLDWDAISAGTVDAELEKASVAFDEAKDKVKRLREESKTAKQALEDMPSGVDTTEARSEVDKLERELNEAEAAATEAKERFEQMSNTKLYVTMEMRQVTDTARVSSVTDARNNRFANVEKEAGDSAAALEQVFDRVADYAERAMDKIVESAETIDAAYRDMRKTVNGAEEDFKHLRDAAIEFSQTHAVSADTILEMESLGGQLGITVEALEDFGRVSSNLDIATDIGAEDIALQLGQITNIMSDLDFTTFESFADALVRLGNNVAAQESSIMNVAQRIAAVANVTSMSTPQLLGWSAAIASTGQRSESAATAITNSITGIGQAVAEGGNKLEAFARIAGMSADDFKEKWESSSSEALEAFIIGLGTLTDDSTDAIEALDAVGISSVRQENALLALSQTIGNLHNSITMADDAFNGIGDKWGEAGDAAREADEKSKGFSGSMQMLRNNLSALADTMSEALVGPIQVASEALKSLTTILNAIPDEVKTFSLVLLGIVTVGGIVAKAIGDVSKMLKSMGTAEATDGIAVLGSKLASLIPGFESASGAVQGLGTALATGLVTLGIGAALTALGYLAAELLKAKEQAEKLDKAQDDLKASGLRLVKAAEGATGSQKDLAKAIRDVRVSADDTIAYINELTRKEEELAEKMEGRNFEMEFDFSKLDEARTTIGRLANSTRELEYLERNDLANAIKTVNDITGSSLELYDATCGKIAEEGKQVSLTTGELYGLISAYKEQRQGEVAYENSADAARELADAESQVAAKKAVVEEKEKALAEARESFAAATKEAVDANIGYYSGIADSGRSINALTDDLKNARTELVNAEEHLASVEESQKTATETAIDYGNEQAIAAEKLNKAMVKALSDMPAFFDALDFTESGGNIRVFADQIIQLGATVEDIKSLSENDLTELARSYDGTIESITKTLDKLGISFEDLTDRTEASFDDLKKASQEAINEQTRANQHAYDALKRELDHQYDAEKDKKDKSYELSKRDYDRQYDLLKRELDHQYDAQKDKYDKDYDAQKDAYDKAYDALKKKLDKDYDAQKDAYDKEYDLHKRELDDIYNAQKDAYDKATDALKDSLDDEYNELKKHLDRQYNEVKKQLDNQYNAVKNQLDDVYNAQKKAYDDEYNELKKQLDKVYDAQKDAYDQEYNELKKHLDDEYTWEKRLRDEIYDEKKKQLDKDYKWEKSLRDDVYDEKKKALDNEYKVAQKASQKYLKQFKKGQSEQVEAFKKATDARVKEIEREMKAQQDLIDAETKRKTDELDARIAALKGATDSESKEQRDRERADKTKELRKAVADAKSRRTRAEAEKELDDYLREIALEDAKEKREALIEELEAEKDIIESEGDERKEKLDEQYDAEVEAFKESRDAELEAYQEFLDERYEMEQEAESARLERLKESQQAELEALKQANEDELAVIKERIDGELEALKQANEDELTAIKETHAAELEELKNDRDERLEALKEQHGTELEARKELHDQWLEQLKDQHDAELESIKEQNDAKLEQIKEQNDAELEAKKEANEAIVNAQKEADEAALLELKRVHEDDLQAMKDTQALKLEQLKEDNEGILQQQKDDDAKLLQQLKDDQAAQLTALKEGHDDILNQKKLDNEDALQAIKDQNELELRTIKEGHEDQLTALKEHNEDIINEMKGNKTKVDTEAKETADAVKGQVDDAASHAEDTTNRTAINLSTKVTETGSDIKGVSKDTADALIKDSDDKSAKLTTNSDNDKQTLVKNWDEIATGVTKKSGETKDTTTRDSDDANKTLTKNSNDNKTSLVKNWNEIGTEVPKKSGETKKSVISDAESINRDGSKQIEEFGKSVKSGFTESAKTVGDKTKEAKDAALGNMSEMEKGSSTSNENIKKDTDTKFGEYKDTVTKKSGEAKDEFEGNVGKMEEAAGNADLASKMDGPLGELQRKIESSESQNWGLHLIENLATGILNGMPSVQNAINNITSFITSNIGHSVPKEGPMHVGGKGEVVWGRDLVDNFIEGIVSKEQLLAKSITGLAEVVEESFNPELSLDTIDEYLMSAKAAYRDAQLDARARMNEYVADVRTTGYAVGEETDMRIASIVESISEAMATAQRMSQESVMRYREDSASMLTSARQSVDDYVDTIAAAYEAIAQISRNAEQRSYLAIQSQQAQPQQAIINVNVTLTDVTIRETADIDRLAQALAKRVDQVTRSRIGR